MEDNDCLSNVEKMPPCSKENFAHGKCSHPECENSDITGGCGCGEVKYCSEDCYRKHWKDHKLVCKNANKPIKNRPKTKNELHRLQQLKEKGIACLQAQKYLNHSNYLRQTSLTDKADVSDDEFKINEERLLKQNKDLLEKTINDFNRLKLDDTTDNSNSGKNDDRKTENPVLCDLGVTLSRLFSEYDETISRYDTYKEKGVVIMIIGYLEEHAEDTRGAVVDIETDFMLVEDIQQRLKLLAEDLKRDDSFFEKAVQMCLSEIKVCTDYIIVLRINILDANVVQTHVYRHKVSTIAK